MRQTTKIAANLGEIAELVEACTDLNGVLRARREFDLALQSLFNSS